MLILLCFAIVYLVFWYFFPLARGAIYEPSSEREVETMVKLSGVRKGQKCADLGSGDGRIVIALAKKGARAHGYEVNPFLVLRARKNIKKAGVEKNAFILWKSFWGADFSDYDLVTIFQVGFIMRKLEKKLFSQMKPGAKIISHYWEFPNIKPIDVKGEIYLYQVPQLIEIKPKR